MKTPRLGELLGLAHRDVLHLELESIAPAPLSPVSSFSMSTSTLKATSIGARHGSHLLDGVAGDHLITSRRLTLPGGCSLFNFEFLLPGEAKQLSIRSLTPSEVELRVLEVHGHLPEEVIGGVVVLLCLLEDLLPDTPCGGRHVDKEELPSPHIIGLDQGNICHPVRGQNCFIGGKELGAELHKQLCVKSQGDRPPSSRSLQLLHLCFPGRRTVEEVVRPPRLVREPAGDQSIADDRQECCLIARMVNDSPGKSFHTGEPSSIAQKFGCTVGSSKPC